MIGNLVEFEVVTNDKLDCKQLIGNINIEDDAVRHEINTYKKKLCFFPIISYSAEKSLKLALNNTENPDDNVYYLYPPLKIVALYLGEIRSSSNPYLKIL